VKYIEYPNRPEKNEITLDTATPDIYTQVQQLQTSLSNPNSPYQQEQAAARTTATAQILSGTGGYVVMNTNADNRIFEILIMDTPNVDTATKVWRWNSGGLGYSSTGYAGTYTTAITQDGAIVADFITTGTLDAELITVVNLIATHVLADDGEANPLSMEISEGYARIIKNTYMKVAMATTALDDGAVYVGHGNIKYSGPGSSIFDLMEDDDARFSYISPGNLFVGCNRNNVRSGVIACGDIYSGAAHTTPPTYYDGAIHAGTLYIKAIAPFGESVYDVSWKQVNLAGGGTGWAICRD